MTCALSTRGGEESRSLRVPIHLAEPILDLQASNRSCLQEKEDKSDQRNNIRPPHAHATHIPAHIQMCVPTYTQKTHNEVNNLCV